MDSNQGQNLRLDPDAGTATAYGNLNPGMPQVVAAGYINSGFSENPAPATMLLVIDAATDQIFTQSPPNDGTLTNGKPLGIDVKSHAAFDIAGEDNVGHLATRGNRGLTLYTVDPMTGDTRRTGTIGNGPDFDHRARRVAGRRGQPAAGGRADTHSHADAHAHAHAYAHSHADADAKHPAALAAAGRRWRVVIGGPRPGSADHRRAVPAPRPARHRAVRLQRARNAETDDLAQPGPEDRPARHDPGRGARSGATGPS